MLHLLSPTDSSVTHDLANLWCSTCVEVKKNLIGRYRSIFGLKTLWWRRRLQEHSFWNVACRSAVVNQAVRGVLALRASILTSLALWAGALRLLCSMVLRLGG
ncbi:hypothetical protein [Pseudomonas sp. FP453]|uniref:hypothetical protein n=1 Tax=Pseudomonas sp. FP453 TaxID=2954094 RepID=UPI00351E8818